MAYYKCGQIYVTENTNTSVGTASGAISTFNTLVSKPLVSLKANFKATQASGTPTPSNPITINGVSSVKVIQTNGDANNAPFFRNLFLGTYGYCELNTLNWGYDSANTRFYGSGLSNAKLPTGWGDNLLCNKYISAKGVAVDKTISLNANGALYIKDTDYTDATTFRNSLSGVYLIYELNTTQTPITQEQFTTLCNAFNINGEDVTINLNNTYYGGYVLKDNSGSKLVLTYEYADLSDFTWNSTADGYSQSPIIPNMKKSAGGAIKPNLFSEELLVDTPANVYNKVTDNTISISIVGANSGLRVYMTSLSGYTGAQVKSALSGFKIAYELETPIELPLTDIPDITTLTGVNNVFNDSGDTECQYTSLPYTIETASGAVANFSTSFALPLISAKYDVDAVQESGTPTPSTPLAISGWNSVKAYQLGGNFFDKTTVTSGQLINASGNEVSYADWNISDYIPVISGASYYLYGLTNHPNTNQDNFELFDTNKSKVGFANVKVADQPYTIPSGVKYVKFSVKNVDLDTAQFGVSKNSAYQSYNAIINTITIPLNDTIYGGYVTQDKNGVKLVVTFGIDDLGEHTWSYSTWGNGSVFTSTFPLAKSQSVTSQKGNIICECYKNETASTIYSNPTNYSMCLNVTNVRIANSDYTNKDTFKTAMSGMKLAYELATPIEINLTNTDLFTTISGTNNVFADSGDSEVVYKKSV